ncbi:CPBP family intramembrane glutamic endopeptidase [Myxococcus sp. RHSTA-1-4]|uniref:CPBP family intramembrane glutamic endopeptidase n=1 Tax=Myxococcus sp. RHSTA-1-4 TaxID=2874601 RepID=UPI001CBAD6C7|nr:type II CAAX endopeptidase family protein [Myxococcus sp. RHSTA-1-4]MBZ4417344.1 CPBP family intramembrane metalloprotease [Myxococcus sp. RHSTA-1-4]
MRYRELNQRFPEVNLLLLMGVLEVAGFAALLAFQHLGTDARGRLSGGGFLGILLFQAAMCAVTMVWARVADGWTLERFRMARPVLPPLVLGILAGAFVSLGMLGYHLLVRGRGLQSALDGESLPAVLVWALPAWLLLAPLLSLKDELLFRGYTFVRLGRARSGLYGLGVSSLLFAVIHSLEQPPTFWQFCGLFATGLYAAWLFHKTGSLWAPVGARALVVMGDMLVSGNPRLGALWKYDVAPEGTLMDAAVYVLLLWLSGVLVSLTSRNGEATPARPESR